jgi:cadmium resistance protein CadD (predicted permease)
VETAGLLAVVAAGAFAATNLDNLLILMALLARPGQSFGSVVAGVAVSVGAILALCVVGALVAELAPRRGLELLGLIPIALGIRELVRQGGARDEAARSSAGSRLSVFAIAMLMFTNSADTFAVLAPLFAETRPGLLPVAALAVVGVALVGCAIAQRLATSERLGPPLQRIAPRLTPFVLIAVGVYVLSNTATDALP